MEKSESNSDSVGLDYWITWQVCVCAFIIAIPTAVSLNLITKRTSSSSSSSSQQPPFNFDDLWRPCWRKLHPNWLLFYRLVAFLTMAWLLYNMLLFAGPFAFYFYTQWTFALVMLYFAVGAVISAQGCLMSSDKPQTQNARINKSLTNELPPTLGSKTRERNTNHDEPTLKASFLGNLMPVIYQLIGSIHSVNAVFLIIDSFLNALPFEWFGFTYFILWSATYVTFQWILHACGSTWWPYPFLELSTPWAPLWYFGLALIHVPCYGVYILLMKAKNSIFSKLCPQAFVRSHKQVWQYKKAA